MNPEAFHVKHRTDDEPIPITDRKSTEINIRKALAGLALLQGHGSLGRCLVRGGFSRSTARRPEANGLTAKRCIEEAAKFDELASPAKLLDLARRRFAATLAAVDPATVPLHHMVRAADTAEKYYGGHQIPADSPTLALAERLAGIAALLAVARERGLPITRTIDVKALIPKVESDNVDYVHSEPAKE